MAATNVSPPPPQESLSSRWREVVLSGDLFASGWILFEFAAAPGVGVAVASLKFGWNDFLTALWLRRRDPDRDRSAVCFWFFVASGLWKITVVAFLLTFVVPKIVTVVTKRGSILPLPTQILLTVQSAFVNYWWLGALSIGALYFAYTMFTRTEKGAHLFIVD